MAGGAALGALPLPCTTYRDSVGIDAGPLRELVRERPYLATCAGVLALGALSSSWTIATSALNVIDLQASWMVTLWSVQTLMLATFTIMMVRRPSDATARVMMAAAVSMFVVVLCGGIWVEPSRLGPLSARIMLVVVVGGAMIRSWRLHVPVAAGGVLLWTAVFLAVTSPPRPWTDWPLSWLLALTFSLFLVLTWSGERRQTLEVTGRLRKEAQVDALTGVLNRAGLRSHGQSLVETAGSQPPGDGRWVTCTFVDVDGMKSVNDGHGHAAGDQLLQLVARALRAATREDDVVGRWGGDEFIVVGTSHHGEAGDLASRVTAAICADPRRPAWWDPSSSTVTAGSATRHIDPATDPGTELDAVIADADAAMYRHRESRRS